MRVNRIFLGFSFIFLGSAFAWAQMKTISGKVLGSDGQPQADVSVTIQGSTKKTYTDDSGNFSIDAEPGQTIEILSFDDETASFIVNDQSFYDVVLQSPVTESKEPAEKKETVIEGVVVTALGITREKKKFVYSTQ